MQIKPTSISQLWQMVFHPPAEGQKWDWPFMVRMGGFAILYLLFNLLLKYGFSPPVESYGGSSILLAQVKHLYTSPLTLGLIPLVAGLVFFKKRSLSTWEVLPQHKAIRFLMMMAAGILTWVYSTYDLNLYANQWHYSDRFLLFALFLLLWWRPIFVYPFLMLLHAIIEQFTALEGFSWAIPYQPFQVLAFFGVYFFVYVVTGCKRGRDFIFFTALLYVTHYWNSGCFKINMFWVTNDHINYLMTNTYANGWLSFLSQEEIAAFADKLTSLNGIIRPMTLLLELGSVLLLFHRYAPKVILFGLACFHTGVFVYSGICFWIWVLMDLSLLALLIRKDVFAGIFPFRKTHLLVFLGLLYFNRFWQTTKPLSWFDVPLTYTYVFEAETESGDMVGLPPMFFAPFDFQFTLGNFGYLNQNKLLPIVWGASSETNAKWFLEPRSDNAIFAREKELGVVKYEEAWAIAFEQFMQQYTSHWNERLNKTNWLTAIHPPRYIWTFPKRRFRDKPQKIKKIIIYEKTTLFQEEKFREIRKRPIKMIRIQ